MLLNSSQMTRPLRVAIAMELEWPYKRHVDIYKGVIRFANEQSEWECVIDDYFYETIETGHGESSVFDGAIGRISSPMMQAATDFGFPVVNVWTNSPAESAPSILVDHAAAGRIAAEHLMERGLRNFACLRIADDRANQLETDAFESAIRAEGFSCSECTVKTESPESRSNRMHDREAIQQWIDSWATPIGVFVSVDYPGRLVAQYCLQKQLRIPDEVAIVAGHNQEIICDQPLAPLTSIEIGYERIGYQAASLLDHLMRNEDKAEGLVTYIPPQGIVTRASTDFLAVKDEVVAKAMKYISSNLHEPITVDDVADAVVTSRTTLERRFREHLNRTVGGEIRRLRLQRACRALASSNQPIQDIALDCGFAGSTQFARSFRSYFGVAPKQYRDGELRNGSKHKPRYD